MVTIKTFKTLALSFDDVVEQPHFEKASFRVRKKIFATLSQEDSLVCIKLSEIDQSVFCSFDKTIIFPVGNKWGRQGWTMINLKKVNKDMLLDALTNSYREILKTKRSSKNDKK